MQPSEETQPVKEEAEDVLNSEKSIKEEEEQAKQ